MSKLELKDNLNDIIIKLSEGNPGAITVLFEIMKCKDNDPIEYLGIFLTIDTMELYGSHLYMLWNDCCDRNIKQTLDVIEAYRKRKITNNDINERIKNVGYGKPFDDLLESE